MWIITLFLVLLFALLSVRLLLGFQYTSFPVSCGIFISCITNFWIEYFLLIAPDSSPGSYVRYPEICVKPNMNNDIHNFCQLIEIQILSILRLILVFEFQFLLLLSRVWRIFWGIRNHEPGYPCSALTQRCR